jgi:hypothetical protein
MEGTNKHINTYLVAFMVINIYIFLRTFRQVKMDLETPGFLQYTPIRMGKGLEAILSLYLFIYSTYLQDFFPYTIYLHDPLKKYKKSKMG